MKIKDMENDPGRTGTVVINRMLYSKVLLISVLPQVAVAISYTFEEQQKDYPPDEVPCIMYISLSQRALSQSLYLEAVRDSDCF